MSVDKTISDLFAELEAATAEHKDAERAESAARSTLTAATNRLNAAQKAVDAHMKKLRESAPWNTDWKRHTGCVVTG